MRPAEQALRDALAVGVIENGAVEVNADALRETLAELDRLAVEVERLRAVETRAVKAVEYSDGLVTLLAPVVQHILDGSRNTPGGATG